MNINVQRENVNRIGTDLILVSEYLQFKLIELAISYRNVCSASHLLRSNSNLNGFVFHNLFEKNIIINRSY